MAIVCGTDYSPMAAQAATVAALLAARLDEPLILLYALDELADFRVDQEAARAWASVFDLARQRLPAEGERLRGYGATVETALVTGVPDEALVHSAEQASARLIVLGSTGRRGPSRWLLGSIAERTLLTSSVPVLVVRAAAPLEAWVRGERPLRIMVGTDLSAVSDVAIRWAAGLRRIGPCQITVVHAADVDESRALDRDLQRRISEIAEDADIRVVVQRDGGLAGRHLASLASEQADLLVVGSRQRTGFDRLWCGTVAGQALAAARTNVACVPVLAPADRRAEPIPELRRVLVATDFSRIGNAAVSYAYAMAAPGGRVHLVHILQPVLFSGPGSGPRPDRTFTPDTACEDDNATRLAALIPDDAQARGLDSSLTIVTSRDVAEGICGAAARLGVDAICMGTHSRSWLAEAIMGSIVRGVASRTTLPLLLVPTS